MSRRVNPVDQLMRHALRVLSARASVEVQQAGFYPTNFPNSQTEAIDLSLRPRRRFSENEESGLEGVLPDLGDFDVEGIL